MAGAVLLKVVTQEAPQKQAHGHSLVQAIKLHHVILLSMESFWLESAVHTHPLIACFYDEDTDSALASLKVEIKSSLPNVKGATALSMFLH